MKINDKLAEILRADGRKLDENQMIAVNSDLNTVVKAGAGSGKTTVLSYRFLRLVLEGKADCDQILTLTFTRKAAAEMNERIYLRLLSAGDEKQLSKFSDASISTLDSFFSEVVKADCIRYGIASSFTVAEEDEAAETYGRLATSVLRKHSGTEELGVLARLYGEAELFNLFEMLGKSCFTLDRHYDPQSWYDEFSARLDAMFGNQAAEVMSAGELLLGELGNEDNRKVVNRFIELCRSLDVDAIIKEFPLLKIDGTKDKKNKEFPNRSEYIGDFRSKTQVFLNGAEALAGKEPMKGVFRILCEFQDEVLAFKRKSASLSFLDISRMALDVLIRNKELRKYYKNKFKYIMIDEFQDNNELQKQILFLLAERLGYEGDGVPGPEFLERSKLFFVGDEKQSIYRFRGADVSVFKSLSSEIVKAGGASIDLRTNYRTEPDLIEEFNRIFLRVMANGGESFEADFESLGTRPAKGIQSRFDYFIKPKKEEKNEDEASQEQAEAAFVANLVKKMTETDEYLIPDSKAENGRRRPKFNEIAILYRTMSRQHFLEKALRVEDIPYCLQATRALMQDAVSNDICNVLQLCLFPEDRLAYLSVLSSPLCHLEGADLSAALAVPPFSAATLSEESRKRYEFASSCFAALKAMSANGTIASMVDFVWNDWGYRYLLVTRKSSQSFMEHFESFWTLARTFDYSGRSLSDFMSYCRPLLGENSRIRDFEILRENTFGVQMMTVHKSKGLEFPIVILCDAASGKGGRHDSNLFICDDGLPIPNHMENSSTRNFFQKYSKDLENQMENAESKRILYVALTRAETHLVVTGSMKARKVGGSFLEMALGNLEDIEEGPVAGSAHAFKYNIPDFDIASTFLRLSDIDAALVAKASALYERQENASYVNFPNRIGVTKLLGEGQDAGSLTVLPVFGSDEIVQSHQIVTGFGTFCHSLMEASVSRGAVPSEEDSMEILIRTAGLDGLSSAEMKQLCLDGRAFASMFLSSDFYRNVVCSASDVQLEKRFFMGCEVEGRNVAVEGVIDLLLKTKDAIIVVDYKTDRFLNPERHRQQLELYREAVRRTTNLPVRCAVVYLRRGDVVSYLEEN